MSSTFDDLARAYQLQPKSQQRQEAAERYTEQLQQQREQVAAQPQRRRYSSRARQTHERWLARDSESAARQYAEAWYQAVRRWRTTTVELPSPSAGRYRPADEELDFPTLGLGGPLTATYLSTPIGQLSEGDVASRISAMERSQVPDRAAIGGLLARLRSWAVTPGTLLRPDGRWERDRPRAAGYAVAVLTLAVELRDPRAEQYLPYVRACQQGRVADLAGLAYTLDKVQEVR